MDRLKNKHALITGADSGIGQAVAVAFAKEGADVAVIYKSDDEGAADTAKKIEGLGRRCLLVRKDVSEPGQVGEAYDEVLEEFGSLDVLVNNAGVEQRGSWEDFELEDWERILSTNLTGYFLMIREALRRKALGEGGRIINTGSIQGLEGSADDPAYSASKGGIHAMTKSLAKYLVESGIRVNCVAPGPVDTPMLRDQSPYLLEGSSKYPLGVASPEDIAPAYVFFASDDSSAFTGEIFAPTAGKVTAG